MDLRRTDERTSEAEEQEDEEENEDEEEKGDMSAKRTAYPLQM